MEEICNKENKYACARWAVGGTSPKGFEHFLAKPTEAPTPTFHKKTAVPAVQKETASPIHPPDLPLQTEIIVSKNY